MAQGKQVESQVSRGRPRLTKRKKIVFAAAVVVTLFAALELGLYLVGVRAGVVSDDPYVGFQSSIPLFVAADEPAGRRIYRTAANKLSFFNEQRFPVEKGDRAYRIFCVGGSTVYGRPYDDRTSFAGWLRRFLPAADPSREWEVINAGGISYASYRVATLMQELVRYQPDLFIIYTGHNEFLERRTYQGIIDEHPVVTRLNLLLGRSRIYSLLRTARDRLEPTADVTSREPTQLAGEVNALLDSSAGLDLYTRDEPLRRQILDHYRFNLGRMVALARAAGAEVVFVQPAANVRDFAPFKSQHQADLPADRLAAWQRAFDRGTAAAGDGDHAAAVDAFEQALAMDDRFAHLHYASGRSLFALGRHGEAGVAFERACDEDVCPLRILPAMHGRLRDVARRHGAALVDFRARLEARLREAAGHALLGADDFLDHVHPTLAGHRLLGRMLVDHLIEAGVVRPAPDWGDARAEAVAAAFEKTLDRRDHAVAHRNLAKVLRWAGKNEEADRLARMAAEVLTEDPQTLLQLAAAMDNEGRPEEAALQYAEVIRRDPTAREAYTNLGMIYVRRGEFDDAVAVFRVAAKLAPNKALTRANLAEALAQSGRAAEAIREFRHTLQIDPIYPLVRVQLAQALLNTGKPDAALAECREALARTPQSVGAYTVMGDAHQRLGRTEQAVGLYRKALAIDPNDPQAHNNLANAIGEQGAHEEAVAHYREAIRHRPDFVEAYYNLGVTLVELDRFEQALPAFDRVVQLRPDRSTYYLRIARLFAALGRPAEAIAFLRRGLAKMPDDVALLKQAGWMLATVGSADLRDGAEAVRCARRACALTGEKDPACLDVLAAAFAETGAFEQAVETARKALALTSAVGSASLTRAMQQRVELYRANRRFRVPVRNGAARSRRDAARGTNVPGVRSRP